MAASKQKKESCKLLILGDTQVGKTTLLKRLETGKFMENVKQTDFSKLFWMHAKIFSFNVVCVCYLQPEFLITLKGISKSTIKP